MIDESERKNASAALVSFLHEARRFIYQFSKPGLFGQCFDPEFFKHFMDALEEYNKSQEFERDVVMVREARAERLYRAGLYGAQLNLKFAAVRRWMGRWSIANPSKRVLTKVLESIDTIMDSMIDALGLGHALKELKDVLLNLIEE
jgi:hypothetical protein